MPDLPKTMIEGVCGLLASVVVFSTALAETGQPSEVQYSAYAGSESPSRVFWGDTHVHTNLSADGNLAGNHDLGPEQAYRFARGEEVVSQTGLRAKLSRPLDFVVLADHAEGLGLLPLASPGDRSQTWHPPRGCARD